MPATTLLVIPASARTGSLNRRLADYAIATARAAGLQAELFDLHGLGLPLYHGDIEAAQGVPASALTLQRAIMEADGVLIVTPEYNGFPTPLLINSFSWLSRIAATDDHPTGLAATANKPAALLSASPGPLGALRSMNFVRQYLQMAFAMLVVPQQFALSRANQAFDATGALSDPHAAQAVVKVIDGLAHVAQALRPARAA